MTRLLSLSLTRPLAYSGFKAFRHAEVIQWFEEKTEMIIIKEGVRIAVFVGSAFLHLLPYIVFSVVLAAGVNQFNFKDRMVEFLKRKAAFAIIIATATGAMSPLCSCGVIPIIFALFQMGIPLAPIMSFWITSPIMSPEAFIITWGNLGIEFASVRLIATIIMGLASGFITLRLFPADGPASSWLRSSAVPDREGCRCESGSLGNNEMKREAGPFGWRAFFADVKRNAVFLSSWLALAFLLEAFITFYLPSHIIRSLFGVQNSTSVIWAALIGIPLYINNISGVPIISALLSSGMAKGAALAFLLAGPVTTIPAMIAVFGLVKRRAFITFLLLGFSLAVVCGYIYDFVDAFI